jgi:hypothetical protein
MAARAATYRILECRYGPTVCRIGVEPVHPMRQAPCTEPAVLHSGHPPADYVAGGRQE